MNRSRLILRNLWYYRRQWLAVMTGVMIATAVVTGALTVGDSVRYSLNRITGLRLGNARYALETRDRYFRNELASEITRASGIRVAAILQGSGIAVNPGKGLRINQVRIIGAGPGFFALWENPVAPPGENEAVISENVAAKLGLTPGDDLLLRIRKQGDAPANAPFAADREESVALHLKISVIVSGEQAGRFSLKTNQSAPFNIFISHARMASVLEIPGKANTLLAEGDNKGRDVPAALDSALKKCWKPVDIGVKFDPVRVEDPTRVGAYQVSTSRIFFDDSTAEAVFRTIPACSPVMTYLVNSLSAKGRSTPYSFVTAAGKSYTGKDTGPGEIVIGHWLAEDLGIGPGDSVWLRYFIMGPLRTLREDSARFVVKEILPAGDTLSDPGLMPDFPGMSDAGNCRDWETGVPIDLKMIRDKDEQYWKDFRGTPKAFIALETGQKIWNNRFGRVTAFRFHGTDKDLPVLEKKLMEKPDPARYGLVFRDVNAAGQSAAANSTDFGELFLSLGFFILAGAVLLTAMLFALLASSRMTETGILTALGFRRRQVMAIFSAEALTVAAAGAIPGVILGILYNKLLLLGLNTLWNDAVNTDAIVMQVRPLSLITGAGTGILVSLGAMLVVLGRNLRNHQRSAIYDLRSTIYDLRFQFPSSAIRHLLPSSLPLLPSSLFLLPSSLLLWALFTGATMNVTLFLLSGGLFLLGGLLAVNGFLQRRGIGDSGTIPSFSNFVLKNIALHRGRTMAVITLLALGTFSVIITGANRKTFYGAGNNRSSGTGGFLLWAETTLPVMNDLNTPAGVKAYGLQDEPLLQGARYIQMTRLDGDDASCLNLNQVSQPSLLGVPQGYFDSVKAFSFSGLLPHADMDHPWKLLGESLAPGMIPGFADATVITWGLRKKIGDSLTYRDGSGKILKVLLAGALDNSIFQGNVLVSDSLLMLYFPSAGGSNILLADGPAEQRDTLAQRLETLFRDQGMMASPTVARLAAFNAVENTYLSVFVLLGGLGVLIGTAGLGIVILRNIRQRKPEFALLLALGFPRVFILRMIVSEHLLMLLAGLLTGILAALAGILPSLISPGYSLPGLFLSAIVLAILLNGLLWIWLPARRVLNQDILSGLRNE